MSIILDNIEKTQVTYRILCIMFISLMEQDVSIGHLRRNYDMYE